MKLICLFLCYVAVWGVELENVGDYLNLKTEYYMPEGDKLIKFPYENNEEIDLKEFVKDSPIKRIAKSIISDSNFQNNFNDLLAEESQIDKNIEVQPSLDDEENEIDDSPIEPGKPLENQVISPEESAIALVKLFGGNPKITSTGDVILNGDIAVHVSDKDALQSRKATSNRIVLWPSKTVPYMFHSSIKKEPKTQEIIMGAMKHWEENTCIKFRPRFLDIWYIRLRNDLEGCWSYIGNTILTLSGQDVSIGRGCESRDIVIHELGHAIGFFHEQARSDREEHAKLLPENVSRGMHSQFAPQRDSSFKTPYDLMSIMQYSPMAFSNKMFEKNTLVARNPHNHHLMGKYTGLTFRDRKIANSLYNCNDYCPNLQNTTCQNSGYLKPYRDDGLNCACDCPPGTKGEFCEEVTGDYYGPPMCGGNITEAGTIETPNYPQRNNPFEDCSWWIQAPEGQKARVEFSDFSFADRYVKPAHQFDGKCVKERVEIRTVDIYHGEMYCGTDIKPGTVMTSEGRDFIILISADAAKQGRGFKANVSFI